VHSPQALKRAATEENKSSANESTAEMVGNQSGGTGIFRLEVKSHELANQLNTEWKESGLSPDKWMQFMSASTNKIQDIAQTVLGHQILEVSELVKLDVLINQSQSDKFVGVEQTLPTQVIIVLKRLHCLDETIARCSNANARRLYREERQQMSTHLKILAAEYQLDVDSLFGRLSQEFVHC
jgi:hypothetical protein